MKNFTSYSKFKAFMLLFLCLGYLQETKACIDPDTVITVTCNYAPDFTQVEIRLSNLKLHTETPNTFCSCALSSWYGAFTSPTYIAFVYEGTNTSYPNFNAWDNTVGADNAWNTEFPNYPNWSGYISEVINSGLNIDDNVEMVIRASTPPGTFAIVEELDSAMASITLGTDMWLPGEQTMAFDHPGIRNIRYDNNGFVYAVKPMSYFEQLDGDILASLADRLAKQFKITIGPNPATSQMKVNYELSNPYPVKMRILDLQGQVIANVFEGEQPPGEHTSFLNLEALIPRSGLYLLEMSVGDKRFASKFFKKE
ncbi:MAG: T9SS type A sorting domain-containing protein [Saprospiraceae bacterium]|nr:T9SS type A sorting domain-containing protein [Saprospiraceae bacterium]MCF8251942.1 T9SS type A sorting domain-containing protein [Saprospiraceae bacterium]MCF8281642.1 T9SS type A sorting domain-containing protein [Bacteroidales bacterium]MCF8313602.1 T9SS type A sorting domain-containing protein [Saprospiraceae bacterium]MCF8442326.1 T9SS type A sorting domain-containing protein [Saprospiraceae bacterium]